MDDTLSYVSSSEADSVKQFAENLFEEKKMLRDSLYLTGRFTDRDQFELKPYRFQIAYLSLIDDRARIKVRFYKNEQGLTQFDLQVFPNRRYPTYFVLQPLVYLFLFFAPPENARHTGFYLTLIVMMILTTCILLALSKMSKNSLRDKCVALFKLQPLV
jgi:hypothetical protein